MAGSREAIEGASVCRSGSTTDWQCGVIRQREASVTYPQGTVFGVTRTSVCAEPGDSGGSFISVDQAQGVTSGGSGDCVDGGVTYFQPVNEILTTYGLTLVTDGNAIPPDESACTGLPKNVTGILNEGDQTRLRAGRPVLRDDRRRCSLRLPGCRRRCRLRSFPGAAERLDLEHRRHRRQPEPRREDQLHGTARVLPLPGGLGERLGLLQAELQGAVTSLPPRRPRPREITPGARSVEELLDPEPAHQKEGRSPGRPRGSS